MGNMYTILINEDHSFSHTVRKKIMCRTTGIESIRFLAKQMYGNLDIKEANVVLEVRTPISKAYKTFVLEASEELYKSRVEFLFPLTLECTKEIGDLEFTINFSYLDKDEDGNFVERVRRIGETSIEISDAPHWSDYIASSELDNIAQIMLTQQSLLEEQREIALMLADEKADGIAKDEDTNEIYLTANGVKLGKGVIDSDSGLDEDGVPVVDLNPSSGEENPDDDSDIIEI